MIAQVLNRDFVRQQMEGVREHLADSSSRRRSAPAPLGAEQLEPDDLREAAAVLDDVLAQESGEGRGAKAPGGGPTEPPAPVDDFAFFSRDPVVSLFQSSLEMYLQSEASGELVVDEAPADGRRGGGDAPVGGETIAGLEPVRSDGRRVFDRFSITDPGWVSSVFAMGLRRFRKRRPFPDQVPAPRGMAANARVILVGDWGSGIPRAQKVADQIRVSIDCGLRDNRECHVVHLGDVYYSGFEREYANRFLKYWPVRDHEAGRIGSWCLNGNHDMYSGGYAYFDFLLKDPRFNQWQGQSSFFTLENETWRICGLDTSWDDNGLKDPQSAWVKSLLEREPRKLMMLSHHQVFSVHEHDQRCGTVLKEKLPFLFGRPDLAAWFWGHEHRCAVYGANAGIPYSSCIGHGGVPVYMTLDKNAPLAPPSTHEYREFMQSGLERWGLMGYAVVDLTDGNARIAYVDENGQTHHRDELR